MHWFLIVLALAIGVASAVQGTTNGILGGRIGVASAVWINAAIVLVGATIVSLAVPRGATSGPSSPWFLYIGGGCGLVIIAGAAFAFPRLGAGPTTALWVAAQLTTALVLDHFGLPNGRVEVTPSRIVGAALLFAGAALVLWPKIRGGGS